MKITADKAVEIAQGVAEMYKIADKYGFTIEAATAGETTWFEFWCDGVEDIVELCDVVNTTFDGELGSVTEQDTVFSIAGSNGWDVDEDNEGQLIIYTNVYDKGI